MWPVEQLRAFRQRVRATRSGRLTVQLIVGLVGGLVVAIGIVLIPFPGPGWLIVLGGLAILAVEFVWAQRLLTFTRARLELWWHWLGRQHWTVRILAGLVGIAFVSSVVAISLYFTLNVESWGELWHYLLM